MKFFKYLFMSTLFHLLSINSIYALDAFERLRFNEKFFIASLNYELSGIASPALYNIIINEDSNSFSIRTNALFLYKDRTPKLIAGILFNGNVDDVYFHIEPIFTNSKFAITDLGTKYSRKNISARIENAFVHYKKNNFIFRFGRSAHWWGKSISKSIIQSGMFPAYDYFFIQYRLTNIHFDLLHGQLGSEKTSMGERIKRNIAGHRMTWKLNDKIVFSFGEQIIYTGKNRGIELTYLNPFVPYFFTGLEDDEESYPADNDNSIIFSGIKSIINENFSIYGEVIVDDLQIDDTGIEDAIGFKVGFDGKINFKHNNLFYIFEWTKIAPWTYLHHGQNTSWINKSHPLGYSYGPNSECAQIKLIASSNKNIDLIVDMSYLLKGFNNIGTDMNDSSQYNFINSSKDYFFGQIGISYKNKWGLLETGWISKNYESHLVHGQTSFNRNSMAYIKFIFDIKKSYILN